MEIFEKNDRLIPAPARPGRWKFGDRHRLGQIKNTRKGGQTNGTQQRQSDQQYTKLFTKAILQGTHNHAATGL